MKRRRLVSAPALWLAARAGQRLPAVSFFPQLTRAGLLMSCGSSLDDTVRRVIHYIDRVLKGAPAGEFAVEPEARLCLMIKLRIARTIDLKAQRDVLLRADEMTE